MSSIAKKWVCRFLCLATWGLAIPHALACIDDGPPLERTHGVYRADSNPWQSKDAPLSLETLDLVSLILPGGSADDWRVEVVESAPRLLRPLSVQELGRILRSTRLRTMDVTIDYPLPQSDLPRLHFGMLRPGDAKIRITHIGSGESHELFVRIRSRAPMVREPAAPEPGTAKRPAPLC